MSHQKNAYANKNDQEFSTENKIFYIFAHLVQKSFFEIYNADCVKRKVIPVELLPHLKTFSMFSPCEWAPLTYESKDERVTLANKSWKIIRYYLELKYKFDHKTIKTHDACLSFLTAYHFNDFCKAPYKYSQLEPIPDYEILLPGVLIILVRKPMPLGFAFYEPLEIMSLAIQKTLTEEEAMEAIISSSHNTHTAPIAYHASVWGTFNMPIPNATRSYICNNCYKPGHFRQYCQQIGHTDMKNADCIIKLPLPSGIPLINFIKLTKEDSESKNQIIYYDRENNLYALNENKYTK